MKTKPTFLRPWLAWIAILLLISSCRAQTPPATPTEPELPHTVAPTLPSTAPTETPTPPPPLTDDPNVKTIYIGPVRVPCTGAAPQECYQFRDAPAAAWGLFYEQITGFTWIPGFEYQLLVVAEPVENPPADASALHYTLLSVLSQNRVPQRPGQSITITSPANQVVAGGTLVIAGTGAGLFEGNVVIQLVDGDGHVRLTQPTIVDAPDAGTGGEGPWQIEVDFPVTERTPLTIYAYSTSPQDGSIMADAIKEIILLPNLEVNMNLENTLWRLVSVPGGDVDALLADTRATITFDPSQNRIFGSAGCNNYFANYTLEGSQLSLGPVGMTMMACPDPQMWVEQAFLKALDQVTLYRLEGEALVFFATDGTRLLEFALETP